MREPISKKFGRLIGKLVKKSGRITSNIGNGIIQEFKRDKNKNKKNKNIK